MTHDPLRLIAASAVALLFVGLWVLCAVAARRRRGLGRSVCHDAVLVAFASQTGFAEELAAATAAALRAGGEAVDLMKLGGVTAETLEARTRALFVVATTGEGDAPDGAARFVRTVMNANRRLRELEVGVLALGDTAYVDYCAFGRRLDAWLDESGAAALFARIEVNAGDPAALGAWRAAIAGLGAGEMPLDIEGPARAPWRIVEQRQLNPDGLGEPAYLIALEPEDPAQFDWQAGDVIEVERRLDGVAHHREYSIASLPADGRLELVVRRQRRPDGSLGLMSGWLTDSALLGQVVPLGIRSNRSFHAPPTGPAVFIGAGTGIAGLRAHIKARALVDGRDAWLLFGERTRARDFLLGEEIGDWAETGRIGRLDLAFSRDGDGPRYVQDALGLAGESLREAIAAGATLFVCGNRQGMGQGVDQTLKDILGEGAFQRLIEDGRYKRDTY